MNPGFAILFWAVLGISFYRSPRRGQTFWHVLTCSIVTVFVTGAIVALFRGFDVAGEVGAFTGMIAAMIASIAHVRILRARINPASTVSL